MAGLAVIAENFEGEVFLVGQIDLNARKPNGVNEFRMLPDQDSHLSLSRALPGRP